MESRKPEPLPATTRTAPALVSAHGWATPMLTLTAALAIVAKIAGVIVAPGLRGSAPGIVVERATWLSGTLAYGLAGLLVAFIGISGFELARNERVSGLARFPVIAISGLVVALASPAVIDRVPRGVATGLVICTSVVTFIGGLATARAAKTRALGIALVLLSTVSTLRLLAHVLALAAGASTSVFHAAQTFATAALVLNAATTILVGAWLAARPSWPTRILVNSSIVFAFAFTWLAGRQSSDPSTVELVARVAAWNAAGVPAPFNLGPIAVFLLPASLFLAASCLLLRARAPGMLAPLALALVSHGHFDVPMHALAAVVATSWAMLARSDAEDETPPPAR